MGLSVSIYLLGINNLVMGMQPPSHLPYSIIILYFKKCGFKRTERFYLRAKKLETGNRKQKMRIFIVLPGHPSILIFL